MGQNWSKVVKIYAKFGFSSQIVRYNETFPNFLEQVLDKNCALKRVCVKTEPHCITKRFVNQDLTTFQGVQTSVVLIAVILASF